MNNTVHDAVWLRCKSRDEYTKLAYPNGLEVWPLGMPDFSPIVVLDLACGAHGLQEPAIRAIFPEAYVVGFDLEPIVALMSQEDRQKYDFVTSMFDEAVEIAPEVVVAIHAVQHFDYASIVRYFGKLKQHAHFLYLRTRNWNDVDNEFVHVLLAPYYDIPVTLVKHIETASLDNHEYHWCARLRSKNLQ